MYSEEWKDGEGSGGVLKGGTGMEDGEDRLGTALVCVGGWEEEVWREGKEKNTAGIWEKSEDWNGRGRKKGREG